MNVLLQRVAKKSCLQTALGPAWRMVSTESRTLNPSSFCGAQRDSQLFRKNTFCSAPAEWWPQRGARERRLEAGSGGAPPEQGCGAGRRPAHVDRGARQGQEQPGGPANQRVPRRARPLLVSALAGLGPALLAARRPGRGAPTARAGLRANIGSPASAAASPAAASVFSRRSFGLLLVETWELFFSWRGCRGLLSYDNFLEWQK
ncbi:chemokine-like protein TAFA-4 isoform X2 [Pan paniscus]|uniref:chemokine-like protein TAFA-4 isoform X2 n=1 Tax=Pan paniscus TaxID=9597 RepID=UPI001560428F